MLLLLTGLGAMSMRCNPSTDRRPDTRISLDTGKIDPAHTRLVIRKSDYEMDLYEKGKLLQTYPVVFGFNPSDDKHMEGDGCTPEGIFKVKSMYDHKSWAKFIWFDYPNAESYRRFEARKKAGQIPETARIGGDIGIHGVPEGRGEWMDQQVNWTLGCVSMYRKDVVEVYAVVQEGTEIEILH